MVMSILFKLIRLLCPDCKKGSINIEDPLKKGFSFLYPNKMYKLFNVHVKKGSIYAMRRCGCAHMNLEKLWYYEYPATNDTKKL